MTEPIYPADPVGHPEDFFPYNQPEPPPHTFEIGLVLGGTGSASCYTAGVLDFLVEALDEWEAAKLRDHQANPAAPQVPRHQIVLRVITSTSGGGLNASVLSRALRYRFPHAAAHASPDQLARNPFYQTFVKAAPLENLFDNSDIPDASGGIPSLMSAGWLDQLMTRALSFESEPGPVRNYVQNPLPVVLTFTNLTGIPYKQDFAGQSGRSEYFINHADFIRLGMQIPNGAAARYKTPPDAVPIDDSGAAWQAVRQYARGTAAFPIGLPAVRIDRPAGHYSYRYVTPNDSLTFGKSAYGRIGVKPMWLKPEWSLIVPPGTTAESNYAFVTVDGGCVNNLPVRLADDVLSGIGPTPAASDPQARRALILVDPFAERPNIASHLRTDMASALLPIFNALMESNRYATADIGAFSDETNYARFLITSVGKDKYGKPLTGGDAIASSGLGAFLGFMSQDYRHHDFMLGRRNCQKFLKSWFALPADASVFSEPKPAAGAHDGERPLIPLYGSAAADQPHPEAPIGAFDPASIRGLIKGRVAAMLPTAARAMTSNRAALWLVKRLAGVLSGGPADRIVAAIGAEIGKSKLLNPRQ